MNYFKNGLKRLKKKEINDPNALALGTSTVDGIPSVRMVLLKSFDKNGLFFIQIQIVKKGMKLKKIQMLQCVFIGKVY